MFEILFNKAFKNENGKDIYIVSIQMKDKFYTLYLTKEEFIQLTASMVAIRDNQLD